MYGDQCAYVSKQFYKGILWVVIILLYFVDMGTCSKHVNFKKEVLKPFGHFKWRAPGFL